MQNIKKQGALSTAHAKTASVEKLNVSLNIQCLFFFKKEKTNGLSFLFKKLYRNTVKKITFLRKILISIWSNCYRPIAELLFIFRFYKSPFYLKSHAEYENNSIEISTRLGHANTAHESAIAYPIFFQDVIFSEKNEESPINPSILLIKSACTEGGTNIIFHKNIAIHHNIYNFENDYTSEELHFFHVIKNTKKILYRPQLNTKLCIDTAAIFTDACSVNYAHWLTEVLPRIAFFCAQENLANIPLIIDANLHPNQLESLFYTAGPDRKIFALKKGDSLQVNNLYLTTATGYVPFGHRPGTEKNRRHSHGSFNPETLKLLRKTIYSAKEFAYTNEGSKKIYLRRNSGTRILENSAEIETILLAQGYCFINPENLTFFQQVQLFKNAEEIISPTGAGLANAIFCSPGARVAVLMAAHKDMIYRYWHNMLSPLGIRVNYVIGNITEHHYLGIHGDFRINTGDVIDLLDAWKTQ